MKKIYTLAFSMVLLMVGSLSANAQKVFSGELTEEFRRSYDNSPVNFSLTEVASYFETDTTTFARALENFMESDPATFMVDDNSDKALYFTTTAGDPVATYPNATQSYSADFNGFWMTEAGVPVTYGAEGFAWFAFPDIDCPNDVFAFRIGQRPSYFTEGASLKLSYDLHYNGKVATFNVDVTIEPAPPVTVTNKFSELTKVGSKQVVVEQYNRTAYDSDAVEVQVNDLLSSLGLTANELSSTFPSRIGTRVYDDDMYIWADSITYQSTANAPGFWFKKTYDEATDTELNHLAITGHGGSCIFYAESFSINETGDTISFNLGQYPETKLPDDSEYTAEVYIVEGTKAYELQITLKIIHKDTSGDPNLSTYTKVGEGTLEQSTTMLSNYYQITTPIANINEIAEALGCEATEITKWVVSEAGSDVLTNTNDDNWGTWVNENGIKASWGTDAVFMVAFNNTELGDGSYVISTLQNESAGRGVLEKGGEFTIPIYLCNEVAGTYYQLNLVYTLTLPQEWDGDFTRVGSVGYIEMSIIPSSSTYEWTNKSELNLDAIENLIGTKDFVLYSDDYNSEKGELEMTKSWSCTPYPGFWYGNDTYEDREHRVVVENAGWGTNSFGITYANGLITYWQYPGQKSVGDSYDANIYLVNNENGKYVQYVIHVDYVESLNPLEEVGSTDVVGVLSADDVNGDGFYNVGETMSDEVYAALGIDASCYRDCTWMIINSLGKLTPFNGGLEGENATFDANGYYVDTTNEELMGDVVFTLVFDEETNRFAIGFFGNEDPDNPEEYMEGKVFQTTVALRYGEKYYKFNIFAGDEQTVTGIKTISGDSVSAGKIYDISGREVANPSRGLYIINGKKVMIK